MITHFVDPNNPLPEPPELNKWLKRVLFFLLLSVGFALGVAIKTLVLWSLNKTFVFFFFPEEALLSTHLHICIAAAAHLMEVLIGREHFRKLKTPKS